MNRCKITDTGLSSLGEGIQELHSLEKMSLDFSWFVCLIGSYSLFLNRCGKITSVGLGYLRQSLQRLKSLQHLSLDFSRWVQLIQLDSLIVSKVWKNHRCWTGWDDTRYSNPHFLKSYLPQLWMVWKITHPFQLICS